MKANELRIGNWVQYQDFESPVQYHCIDGCNIERLWLNHDNDYYEPIPLTPELLEMCGFENNELYFDRDNTQYRLLSTDGVVSLWVEGYYQFGKAKYLHQLQNLVFALTGEELTVNLSELASLNA